MVRGTELSNKICLGMETILRSFSRVVPEWCSLISVLADGPGRGQGALPELPLGETKIVGGGSDEEMGVVEEGGRSRVEEKMEGLVEDGNVEEREYRGEGEIKRLGAKEGVGHESVETRKEGNPEGEGDGDNLGCETKGRERSGVEGTKEEEGVGDGNVKGTEEEERPRDMREESVQGGKGGDGREEDGQTSGFEGDVDYLHKLVPVNHPSKVRDQKCFQQLDSSSPS